VSELRHAESFRELIVHQKARKAAQAIFQLSKSFPKEEMYSFTDQIRRASRFVGAQIAEAWGKRQYQKHFISKLTDADAEQLETQHWIDVGLDCGYLTTDQHQLLLAQLSEIGRMLRSMISKADQFCGTLDDR
jgi:four helix bundle protein